MEWLLPLFGGLGIGALLKGVVDHFLGETSKANERLYREKRETYLGFLDAIHQSDTRPSIENAKEVGNWANRCRLFGSVDVIAATQAYVETGSDVTSDARRIAFNALFEAMRADLRK